MNVKEELKSLTFGKKIYCYGAGYYGKIVAYALMDIQVKFEGFVVTQRSDNQQRILHKPVIEVNDIPSSDNNLILVCVSNLLQGEIISELKKCEIENYYCLSEIFMEELDKIIDFNIDIDNKNYINVLLYHRVCDLDNDFWKLAVSPEHFEIQMKYIKENYNIIKFEDDWSRVDRKSIVITFDDGYIDNYRYAIPILKKYNIPATFFVSTDNIDTRDEFWWDELSNMVYYTNKLPRNIVYKEQLLFFDTQENKKISCLKIRKILLDMDSKTRIKELDNLHNIFGFMRRESDLSRTMNSKEIQELSKMDIFTIGAHTKAHCRLSGLTRDQQFEEIYGSKNVLEEIIQKEINIFSYPFGNGQDYSSETVDIVKNCGFKKACVVQGGLFSKDTNDLQIPRNTIPGQTDLKQFKKILNKCWFEY